MTLKPTYNTFLGQIYLTCNAKDTWIIFTLNFLAIHTIGNQHILTIYNMCKQFTLHWIFDASSGHRFTCDNLNYSKTRPFLSVKIGDNFVQRQILFRATGKLLLPCQEIDSQQISRSLSVLLLRTPILYSSFLPNTRHTRACWRSGCSFNPVQHRLATPKWIIRRSRAEVYLRFAFALPLHHGWNYCDSYPSTD